jgi:hypothetical protein
MDGPPGRRPPSQEMSVRGIEETFGPDFIYEQDFGRRIDKRVLGKFKVLTAETVVWVSYGKAWRTRESYDKPDRTQRW